MATAATLPLEIRDDGYVNATKMCRDGGKEWKMFSRQDGTAPLVRAVSQSVGIEPELLICTYRKGANETRGTYIHPDIAIPVAHWISPEIGLFVLNTLRPASVTEPETICRLPPTNFTHGDITLQFRDDGYVNATKMCQDAGKLWGTYRQNQGSTLYFDNLSRHIGIPIDHLIITTTTGPNELRGTYVHRDIAIDLAQPRERNLCYEFTSTSCRK